MDLVNELQNLDPKEIGTASLPIRAGAILLACIALIGAGYYYLWKPRLERIGQSESKEEQLKYDFLAKAKKAANIQEYRDQVKEVERLLTVMKQQLPKEAEIPDLLVDISQTALASGLEIERFQPGRDEKQALGYVKTQITLRMTGQYEEFAAFLSGVAALPRIVTMENVSLVPVGGGGTSRGRQGSNTAQGDVRLAMDAIAATYRYSDEDG